jgi:hypothetical protein
LGGLSPWPDKEKILSLERIRQSKQELLTFASCHPSIALVIFIFLFQPFALVLMFQIINIIPSTSLKSHDTVDSRRKRIDDTHPLFTSHFEFDQKSKMIMSLERIKLSEQELLTFV